MLTIIIIFTLITLKSWFSTHSGICPSKVLAIFQVIFIWPLCWQIFSSLSLSRGSPSPNVGTSRAAIPESFCIRSKFITHFSSSIPFIRSKWIIFFSHSCRVTFYLSEPLCLLIATIADYISSAPSTFKDILFSYRQSSFSRWIRCLFSLCLLLSFFVRSSFSV